MPDSPRSSSQQANATPAPSASQHAQRRKLSFGELYALGLDGEHDTGPFGAIRPAGAPSRLDEFGRSALRGLSSLPVLRDFATPVSLPSVGPVRPGGPAGTSQWARDTAADPSRAKGYRVTDPNDEAGGELGNAFTNGFGVPKCNIFVYDALRSSGIQPPLIDGNVPVAKQWADPGQVAGYRVVGPDEPLRPGDVITNGHHVGIYTPEIIDGVVKRDLTTSAATPRNPFEESSNPVLGGPVTNDWGFREPGGQRSPGLVVRRYVSPNK